MTITHAISILQSRQEQTVSESKQRIQRLTQLIADRNEMNAIPQDFYDIRYGWLQVIVGAVHKYHPFIRDFLAKVGGEIYGSEEKDKYGNQQSWL